MLSGKTRYYIYELSQQRTQIDIRQLLGLPATKCQQLFGDRRSLFCRSRYVSYTLNHRTLLEVAGLYQVRVAGNNHQQVVEIMSNTPSELTNGFHSLCLLHL